MAGVKGRSKAPPHAFVPGQSGNPAGRPPESQTLKLVKKASREDVADFYERIHGLNKAELMARLWDPMITVLEETYIRAMIADMERGLTTTADRMREFIHGKNVQPIVAQVGVKRLEDLVGWE